MRYTTQRELQQGVTDRLRAVESRLHSAIGGLAPAQLARTPPQGGWSIAQVCEHLCVVDDAYRPVLERRIRSLSAPRRPGADVPWRPRWGGRVLMAGLTRPRKLKAPRRFRVGAAVRPNVAGCLLETFPLRVALMQEAHELHWQKIKLGSVATSILRLNLGDVFLVDVIHLERHTGQIERLRGHAQFANA